MEFQEGANALGAFFLCVLSSIIREKDMKGRDATCYAHKRKMGI